MIARVAEKGYMLEAFEVEAFDKSLVCRPVLLKWVQAALTTLIHAGYDHQPLALTIALGRWEEVARGLHGQYCLIGIDEYRFYQGFLYLPPASKAS
jgi:hypothetical protein